MRINSVENHRINPVFRGFTPVKDDMGHKEFEFSYPFDDNTFECYLEIFKVKKDKNSGEYKVVDIVPNVDEPDGVLKLNPGVNKVNLASSYFISPDEPFAYHYKLKGKNWKDFAYRVDAGDIIDNTRLGGHEIYNLVTENVSNLRHGGSMKLVVPDSFNVGYVYNPVLFSKKSILKDDKLLENAKKSVKNFSNKMGGTLAGIEEALDKGKFDGYSSIVSLPIFTDDNLSPHSYWNKNCMQMSSSLGNVNNYASLQRKMFGKGINFVSDGAFVNEGLEGVHFTDVLKWGQKSPFYHWFKAEGLKDGPLLLGVFGKNTEHISQKIVNSPYKYTQKDGIVQWSKNRDYNPDKPTYVQIFDDRLVSDKLKQDTKNLITSYDILSTTNPYEINTHNDTVINYHFEINPETFHNNVKELNKYNQKHSEKALMDKIDGMRILDKFENFELEEKMEGGFYAWDANTDIAKLNFTWSNADEIEAQNHTPEENKAIKQLQRNRIQVKDYTIRSGQYWTKKTADILRVHIAQNLKNIAGKDADSILKLISDNINKGIFPNRLAHNINKDVVDNVLMDLYYIPREDKFGQESYTNLVLAGLMNMPLDTIEFGDNIVSVLSSPYITKFATSEDEVGLSRYDLYKKGNPHLDKEYVRAYSEADKLYEKEMLSYAKGILQKVNDKLPATSKLYDGEEVTKFGEYVLPLLTAEIAKFAVIKSLKPDEKVYVDNNTGEIGYDYKNLKDTHLQSLKIYSASPENDAREIIAKIKSGIGKISKKDTETLTDALFKSLNGTSKESFALAEVILDRSQSGLDWRIDAAKDISDIDSLRNHYNKFDDSWAQVTDFWSQFNKAVLAENPNSYIVAEVTDEDDFYDPSGDDNQKLYKANINDFSRYKDKYDIRRKMINEMSLTSIANYRHIFSWVSGMFGKSFENGSDPLGWDAMPSAVYEKLIGKENYLQSSNLASILYSYTFAGNHDKPRALHCLALDMGLFYADLTSASYEDKKRAYKVLNAEEDDSKVTNDKLNEFNFKYASAKAVAMGETMKRGLYGVVNDWKYSGKISEDRKQTMISALSRSIMDLAKGSYLGEKFEADGFGVKPIDVNIDSVITQARRVYGLDLSNEEVKELRERSFDIIMEPAMQKLLGIMKYLVALPGKPTMYAGDELASSGYETKTKNIYLQNRGYVHNEWLNDKKLVANFNKAFEDVMGLRARPELDALNNGAPFVLKMQKATDGKFVSALLRQNTDGKMAISLFNPYGLNRNNDGLYYPETVILPGIDLNAENGTNKIGLLGGLKPGMIFKNADSNDKSEYVVDRSDKGEFYIKRKIDKQEVNIEIKDTTMNLYYDPAGSQVSFSGKIDFKPSMGFVVNAYDKVSKCIS